MADSDLTIKTQSFTNYSLIQLIGQIDAKSAPQLNKTMQDLIQTGKKNFIFDMSEVTYLASAGIGTFMAVNKLVRAANGKIIFAKITAEVKDIFELLKIDVVFDFAATVDDAKNRV